jgi:hypothetical protein
LQVTELKEEDDGPTFTDQYEDNQAIIGGRFPINPRAPRGQLHLLSAG